jgi:hypothetical protein
MTYAMSSGPVAAAESPLAEALLLTVRTIGSSCADADGAILYDGPLADAALGSSRSGRSLAAATAEILCFRALLPLDSGNALQGADATVSLTFVASSPGVVQ